MTGECRLLTHVECLLTHVGLRYSLLVGHQLWLAVEGLHSDVILSISVFKVLVVDRGRGPKAKLITHGFVTLVLGSTTCGVHTILTHEYCARRKLQFYWIRKSVVVLVDVGPRPF